MNDKIKNSKLNYNYTYNPQNYILDPESNHLFRKGKKLGGGGFGEVYEFIDNENGEIKAAKIIPLKKLETPHSNEAYFNEYKFNNSLNYKYICKCYSTFKDTQNAYFILEYQPNKTLSDLISNRYTLTEIEVKHYCYELLLALEYLHSRNIIHRDIKLSNVLLSEKMEVKLCDFGLAIENRGDNNKTICGTPNYIAPEILNHKNTFNYSFETDIWSFGIIVYTLFFHKTPFESPEKGKTRKNIQNIIYSFPSNNEVNENAKDLIRKIFVKNPSQRPSIKEIKECNFFQNGKGIPKYMPSSTRTIKLSEEEMDNFVKEAILKDECLDKEFIKTLDNKSNSPYFKYNSSFENEENNESELDSDKDNSTENAKNGEKDKVTERNNTEKKSEKILLGSKKSKKSEKDSIKKLEDKNEKISLKLLAQKNNKNNIIEVNNKNKIQNENNNNENIKFKIENNNRHLVNQNKEELNSKINNNFNNFNSFGKISFENMNESDLKKINSDSFHPYQDTNDNNKTTSKEKITETLLSDTINLSKNTSINSNLFASSKKLRYRNSSSDLLFHQYYNKSNKNKITLNLNTQNKNCENINVLHFIDLSKKCGIGYILSNGDIGAYFNDNTKLILIKSTLNIIYIDSKEKMTKINLGDKNNLSIDILRKIKILSLFNKRFIKNIRNKNEYNINSSYDKQTVDAYVIKWTKTQKASFFLLSNKEVQVIFIDKTQVIFNLKTKIAVFINHLKQKFTGDMRLNEFSSFEMTIRVLYAKKVLTKL